MKKVTEKILNSGIVQAIKNALSKAKVPGTEGLSVWDILAVFYDEFENANLNNRTAAVTYNFLMAIAPTLLFVFTLIPYLPLEGIQETILSSLHAIFLNEQLYTTVSGIINDFMTREQTGILSFSVLLTLYYSSNGMMGLINNFDRNIAGYKKISGFKKRLKAIALTVILMLLALIAIAMLIIQSTLLNQYIEMLFGGVYLVKVLSYLILLLVLFFGISIVYKFAPSFSIRTRLISVGSVFTTIAIIILGVALTYLIGNFINYNQIYGSIGSFILFLLWLYLNTFVILLGYELNVSIVVGKRNKINGFESQDTKPEA